MKQLGCGSDGEEKQIGEVWIEMMGPAGGWYG